MSRPIRNAPPPPNPSACLAVGLLGAGVAPASGEWRSVERPIDPGDPRRTDLAPATYRLKVGNLDAAHARVQATDPLTGEQADRWRPDRHAPRSHRLSGQRSTPPGALEVAPPYSPAMSLRNRLLHALALACALAGAEVSSAVATWRSVERPIDPAQLSSVPFGFRSFWQQPWRAYLDTPPATALRDGMGIHLNIGNEDEARVVAPLLRDSGIKTARLELSWTGIDLDDRSRFTSEARIRSMLGSLRDSGVRPLILLNANSGAQRPELSAPCRHTPEQVIRKLREANRLLAEGKGVAEVAKELGVSENTYHRWRDQYGGMKAADVKRLKELERENGRLSAGSTSASHDPLLWTCFPFSPPNLTHCRS